MAARLVFHVTLLFVQFSTTGRGGGVGGCEVLPGLHVVLCHRRFQFMFPFCLRLWGLLPAVAFSVLANKTCFFH